ncbi:hypothetical protein ABZ705_34500, partial [Streptomyces sp. NPDC006984]|uniref:hypothetical protein n=1 Tax=Streptomyces sp. NPDC006984 TaxID=3155463 RepID=UPI0033FC710D
RAHERSTRGNAVASRGRTSAKNGYTTSGDTIGVPVASYAAGAAPERTRSALLAAAAIGGLTLTTEVSIADAPVEGSAVEGMGGLGQTM